MAKKLKLHKTESGEPAVKCPRCDELVQPEKSYLFEGYDCPECGQIISDEEMILYTKKLEEMDDDYEF